jgi:hypothetical protein
MNITTPNITKFMPSNSSIIFELNNTLRVYSVRDSVNDEIKELVLLRELVRETKVLDLADKFEFLWHDLTDSGLLDNIDKIYYLIGQNAGFTDSRMIYVWLKSWQMFTTTNTFYISKIVFDAPIDFVSHGNLSLTLQKAETEKNNTSIGYSKEPNITNNFKG